MWVLSICELNPKIRTGPHQHGERRITVVPENLQLRLEQCPVLWDSRVSVFHSTTATFRAPSNPSGPGGMYRETIRSTPQWTKGETPAPRRDCVFVNEGDSGAPGMRCLFFKFSFANVEYPCALVHWYTTIGSEPDSSTGLWVVEPEYGNSRSHLPEHERHPLGFYLSRCPSTPPIPLKYPGVQRS